MKTKILRPAATALSHVALFLALCATRVASAPLTETTAVHKLPDRTSPAIAFLKAGTDPVATSDATVSAPMGWMAVDLPGPFEVYVENKDLTKSLDVKPGAPLRLAPKPDAGVLIVSEKGDQTNITGVLGKWTQLSLEKKIVGYIDLVGGPAANVPLAAQTAVAPAPKPAPSSGAAASPAPMNPTASGVAAPGQAAPTVNLGDSGGSLLPRQFAGQFVSTRRVLAPRRPYDWALNDNAGKRYAYLDVSRLLLTEQIEKYAGHAVEVFGAAKATPDGKDFVIMVESLQLK